MITIFWTILIHIRTCGEFELLIFFNVYTKMGKIKATQPLKLNWFDWQKEGLELTRWEVLREV